MRKRTVFFCALAVATLGQAASASVYAFDWTRPSQATIDANGTIPYGYQIGDTHVGEMAGNINAISATYDDASNRLTFSLNIGEPQLPGQSIGGFSLVLTNGAMPDGPGQWSSFYFDASGINPVLTGYAYNGHPWSPSHEDGSWLPGVQPADPIFSSLNDVNSVINSVSNTQELDGSHTLAFDINVASILAHVPMYPIAAPWEGTGFDELIGIWMRTFTNVNATYNEDGFIETLCSSPKFGYFDSDNMPTVPAPGALALLGLGLVARRRQRIN